MLTDSQETIAAPITAPGAAAVSTVRISGAGVSNALSALLPSPQRALLSPRKLAYSPVLDLLASGEKAILDYALVAYFPGPESFTGEDCAEISLHGSPYILGRLLECLASVGVRMARAGEFSERAFHNGKLDLSQAEAVADLVSAETEAQARVAREQLEGRLSAALSSLGEPLRNLLAEIEAYIDFPEEDIEPLAVSKWLAAIAEVQSPLDDYIGSFEHGRICREGAQVVLAGLPNAGKSSLLNALLGEQRAIVTPIPGTTRDSIEDRISIAGLAVRIWDTAGILESGSERTPDEVERQGIERSKKHLEQADLAIVLLDPEAEESAQKSVIAEAKGKAARLLFVLNKLDSLADEQQQSFRSNYRDVLPAELLAISAKDKLGLDELREAIAKSLLGQQHKPSSVLICNRRHLESLQAAKAALVQASVCIEQTQPAELCAFELRAALSALSEIVGVTSTEDVLGRIFSKFCIGK